MKYVIGIFLSLFVVQIAIAQPTLHLKNKKKTIAKKDLVLDDVQAEFAKTISADDMKKHLTILASDEYEGRETGAKGNRMAADYLAEEFKKMGLPGIGKKNTYFQNVSFSKTQWEDCVMYVNGEKFKHLWEFLSFPNMNENVDQLNKDEVIFLGYGIDDPKYSDYKGRDVKGKVVMVYKDEPMTKDGNSRITGTTEKSDWSKDLSKKLMTAKKNGVAHIMIIENELQAQLSKSRSYLVGPSINLGDGNELSEIYANNSFISTNVAKAIMGKRYKKVIKRRDKARATGKTKPVRLKSKFEVRQKKDLSNILGDNVMGFIEGSDPKLKDEVVIITAHYDHLGKKGDEIYNGADDNGSGTSTVLDVAEAFAKAKAAGKAPKRSVMVMLVTGEEKGLLGSQYYTEYPVFPLEKTVANINVDMVGRVDEKYKDNPSYVYVIGSDRLSTELHNINESANKKYTNLTLDYTYNAEDDPNRYYYRSDHYNFAVKGIPAIFYFNGTHPDYHRTTDTVEKINFEKMEKIGKLVFHTAWELADRKDKIKVDVIGKN